MFVRWTRRLLWPHALAVIAFGGADAARAYADTNRSLADLRWAVAGFVLGGVAIAATIIVAVWFPTRTRHAGDGAWLAAHVLAVIGLLALASRWLGGHIA